MIPRAAVPRLWYQATLVALLLAVTAHLVGCGPSAREQTLRGTLTAVNAGRASFVVWDARAQATIVADALTKDDGVAALAAHRVRRDRVLIAFEGAYRTLAVAAAETNAERLTVALAAVATLWAVYKTIVGAVPPGAFVSPQGPQPSPQTFSQ